MNATLRTRRPGGVLTVLAALSLALAGCASSPALTGGTPTLAEAVPTRWLQEQTPAGAAAPSDAVALARWWQRFGDAELDALIEASLQAHGSVKRAQAALSQARALRDAAAGALLPALNLGASVSRSRSGQGAAAIDSRSVKSGFDASWEPDVFGGNAAALAEREASLRASQAELGDVQRSIAAEVALNYITLRGSQQRLEIARANLAAQDETLQLTQWRLQAGLTTSLEAEQARSAAEQTRATLPTLQTARDQAAHALALLTGRTPEALAPLMRSAAAPVPLPPQDLALAFPADTLRQRPDVRAAEASLSAALARVAQADAARRPSFKLSGSLGLSAASLSALGDSSALLRSLLASVTLPLFDGGALAAQQRAAQAGAEQYRAAYETAVLTALQEVEDALVALRNDRTRLATLQRAADAAANAALLARQRHASGLVDFQTVLDTQRTLLSTQDGVASAIASVAADHVRLYKALGGGWQPEAAAVDGRQAATERTPRS